MAQAGQQQRKDLELVFSLQSHYKHFFKNYGDIVGVYDIPSITMQWESFKSYLLKNSGIMFDNIAPPSSSPSAANTPQPNSPQLMDDIQIRYVNTAGLELPINSQDDFQYALYSFRERARISEINHLKLTRVKANNVDGGAENAARTRNYSGGDGLEVGQADEEKPPEWFGKYMKKFKQDVILEISRANTAQMSSNLKKMQAANHVACPKRRQNKSEHYKRRPKMTYANNIATENTSCDNTDVNTITTTPTLINPQTFTPTPPKLLNAQTRNKHDATQTKPDNIINKQIKLKAKRLATSNGANSARASSDSDTLTVIKQTAVKADNGKTHELRLKYAALKKKPQNRPFSTPIDSGVACCAENSLVHEHGPKLKPPKLKYNAPSRYMSAERDYSACAMGVINRESDPFGVNEVVDVVRMYGAQVVEEDECWSVGVAEQADMYVKKWRIRNTGERAFNTMTTLRFTWGSLYPIIPWAECPFLQPDESGWLSVCIKIPEHVGSYECHCRLYQGSERFGPWLGFRLHVTALEPITDQSNIVSRVRITSLFPPQRQYSTATLLNNCSGNQKVVQNCADETIDVDVDVDDVVAVIQGMVVRDNGLDKLSDDLSACKVSVLGNDVRSAFKENEQISTDVRDEVFINAPDHNMRYTIEKQQVNKKLHMRTDSDNDEEDSDDDDDINVGKDLVIVDKHHLQDNSDSDNVSIVSIAESNQSAHSVAATNISVAGSFSSGNVCSASDEFVVIPMPKRGGSCTLSDGDDNSCPELEPDPECYGHGGVGAEEGVRGGEMASFVGIE